MRLTYLSSVDLSLASGPGVNEREFVRAFQEESKARGDLFHTLVPAFSGSLDFDLENARLYDQDGSLRAARSIERPGLYREALLEILKEQTDLLRSDLFIIRISPQLLEVCAWLRKRRQRFVIKTLGNIYKFTGSSQGWRERARLARTRHRVKRILKRALVIDVCTEQFKRHWDRVLGSGRVMVVPNAVNTSLFAPRDRLAARRALGLERYDAVIGYCGGSPSARGARQLVDLAPRLVERYPGVGILIVGADGELDSLQRRTRDLGLDRQFVFTGRIPYEQVPAYMNCLDVGIGLDAIERLAAIGNSSQKIRQYLACGVPVICGQGTNTDLVEAGLGRAVSPDDLEAVWSALNHYLDVSPAERERFVDRACQYARNHLSTRRAYQQRHDAWRHALERCGGA